MKINNMILVLLFISAIIISSGCTDSPDSESSGELLTPNTPAKDTDSIKSSALEVSYGDLYGRTYEHQIIYYRGQILKTATEGNLTYWTITTGASPWGGYMNDVILVIAENHSDVRLLEGDIVDVWAESDGVYNYEIMGTKSGIPLFYEQHIEFVERGMEKQGIISEKGAHYNHARIQESIICTYSNKTYNFSITNIIRGSQANNIIAEANMYNDEVPNGYEYALVKMKFHYSEGTETFNLSSDHFEAVFKTFLFEKNSDVSMPDNYTKLSSSKLMPGETKEGWLVFTVPINEGVLILYQDKTHLENPVCYINIGY